MGDNFALEYGMGIREYEQSLEVPLKKATLVLLLKGDEVLLAMKKRGFGAGKWNGVGGKSNEDEEIVGTAVRETQEEIEVTPINLKPVAIFNYHFPLQKGWGLQVYVFTATGWRGEPTESEEMKPKWFNVENVPYKEMWVDDEVWMPKVFAGLLLKGSFMFGEDETIEDYFIDVVESIGVV